MPVAQDGMEIMSEECDSFNSVPYYRGVKYATHFCVLSAACCGHPVEMDCPNIMHLICISWATLLPVIIQGTLNLPAS